MAGEGGFVVVYLEKGFEMVHGASGEGDDRIFMMPLWSLLCLTLEDFKFHKVRYDGISSR